MKQLWIILLLFFYQVSFAQKENEEILKGNEAYYKGDYFLAETHYNNAINLNAKNAIAYYNKGNALFKQNKFKAAAEAFEQALQNSNNALSKPKYFYNKGVAEAKQAKWKEAVTSFKQALKISPNDKDIQENLQKALDELKKQQPKQNPSNNNNNENKNPPSPKLSKEQIENELTKLRNEEKRLQQDLQKKKIQKVLPDKDW